MLPGNQQPEYTSPENEAALNQLRLIEYGLTPLDPAVEGHKYGLPDLPLPEEKKAKHRYDAVITQITRLLMRDGKLAKAQRVREYGARARNLGRIGTL
jgi:small subunit ribosomal protein S7